MKKTKKWYKPKNEQHAKHSIFFTGLQHMSHLWTKHICIESPLKHLPIVSTLTFLVLTPEFILLPLGFRLSISKKPFIAYESSLFCKLCCPCHFWCHAFVQRMLLSVLVLCWPFSLSLAYLEQMSVWSISYVLSAHSGLVLVLDVVGYINALLPMVSPHWLQLIIWDWDWRLI